MDLRDIQNLIKFVAKSGASEVKLEMEDVKITIKTNNEIESEVSGKIVKILVDDSSPVEFDQPLYLVDPS